MRSLVRALGCIVGIGAILWGSSVFSSFRKDTSLHHVASEYLLGRGFGDKVIQDELKQVASAAPSLTCNPTELHDEVILHLAVFNNALGGLNRSALNLDFAALQNSTRRALSCEPFDSFSWLTLFWLDSTQHGINPRNLTYLRLSYALGPNEGWIATWRNRLAIPNFAKLPPDLGEKALEEFVKLVDAGYLYSEAATIFASATPAVRQSLIERVKLANDVQRQIFARILYDKGFDVIIPGVTKPARPWE